MPAVNPLQVTRQNDIRLTKRANHPLGKEPAMLKLTIQMLGDLCVFHCAGRILANDEDFLRPAVRSQACLRAVVLDLAEVSAIDAAGVGMLVSLREWAESTHVQLKLINLTPRVEEVLRLTNLIDAFEVCSVREMVDLLCSSSNLGHSTIFKPLFVAS